MPAQWTGDVIGKMHVFCITQTDMAKAMGCSREYTNKVMNGKCTPAGAEQKFRAALDALIAEKQQQ